MSPLGSARGFSWQPHRGDIAIAPSGRHRNNQPLGLARGGTLGLARGGTLGFARGGTLGFARGATLGFARGATLGFARGATLGIARDATLGIARDATVMTYRKIMSVMREKPIWLLIFEMNSCFRRVNS